VETLELGEFAERARALRRLADGTEGTLLGRFPGHPDAMTCLDASGAGPGWTTVHAYPETGTWVFTETTVHIGDRPV
jgi:hypothetical protein